MLGQIAGFIHRLFNRGISHAKSEEEEQFIVLVNKLSLLFALLVIPFILFITYLHSYILAFSFLVTFFILISIFWLNGKGNFPHARLSLIIFINACLFFYIPTFGYEVHLVFIYFPFSCLPILLYPVQEKKNIYFGFLASILSFFILKMELLPAYPLIQASASMLYLVNLLITLTVLITFIYTIGFMYFAHYKKVIRLNEALSQADTLLKQHQQIEIELKEAKEKAEAGSKSKSEFLSTMSHEIRTPLNAMIGFSGLLEETTLTKEQGDYIHTIKRSGDNLLSIINDILDHAKIESGKLELEYQDLLIKEPILDTLDLLRSKANEKDLTLSYSIAANVPPIINSDITRIRQVLVNLVNNAIKFTKQGEISIQVIGEVISPKNHKLQFCIQDTGIGISEAGIERLFKSFSQVDASTTRKYGGTGLGLAICKQLVELLGGNIWVESTKGIGSKFFFSILCKEGVLNEGNIEQSRSSSKLDIKARLLRNTKSLKILLAEDNHINQKVAARVLSKIGYEIDIANNGLEVLEAVKRTRYDLILMDMQMPEMDGVEASKQIQVLFPDKNTRPKIFALTANALKEDRDLCLAAGMDDFIKKPFRVETLDEVIYAWFYTEHSHL